MFRDQVICKILIISNSKTIRKKFFYEINQNRVFCAYKKQKPKKKKNLEKKDVPIQLNCTVKSKRVKKNESGNQEQ